LYRIDEEFLLELLSETKFGNDAKASKLHQINALRPVIYWGLIASGQNLIQPVRLLFDRY